MNDECAVDEICGGEGRVRRGRVCNWLKVTMKDGGVKEATSGELGGIVELQMP
jgi:hypothetical protein